MAHSGNRKRTKRIANDNPLYGDLFHGKLDAQGVDIPTGGVYQQHPEEPEPREPVASGEEPSFWRSINGWHLTTCTIFLIFTAFLYWLAISMWVPQDMRDIAGYTDKGAARDLTAILRNANGGEVVFTEAEINRYLRDTCRMRQTGVMAILSHSEGVALRIHDGYCEFIIDRLIGSNLHQTTSVYLTFRRVTERGRQTVRMDICGGEPMLGGSPRGGRIGRVDFPQQYMRMLQPPLETLTTCYKDFFDIIHEHGYFPTFTKGGNGRDATVLLTPMNSFS